MYEELTEQGYLLTLTGIGKDTHLNSLSNWTSDTSTPVCADSSPFNTWSGWSASQRDLFVLDQDGNLIHHQNITSGIPNDLEEIIISNLSTNATSFVAKSFRLNQNYPNPFNPTTTIPFDIVNSDQVRLIIYNVKGEIVRTLLNSNLNPGSYEVRWNGRSDSGIDISAGMYFIELKGTSFRETSKMIYLK